MLHNGRSRLFGGAVCLALLACVAYGDIPSDGPLRLTVPTRMVKNKALTLKAEILDQYGCKAEVDWRIWSLLGEVTARRVSDGRPVPTSITFFEDYFKGAGSGTPPPDSIRFYNGIGSVSITLDDPDAVAGELIEIVVTAGSRTASKRVLVLDDVPATYKPLSGTLSGADLAWGPDDGVIHLTGHVTVPGADVLTIAPGTLIMADKGTPEHGIVINVDGRVHAVGTADNPIFFFAAEGAPAMELVAGNEYAWGGIYHDGPRTSTYEHVIMSGGGNGMVGDYHLYPPLLRFFDSHSLDMSECTLVDNSAALIVADYGSGTIHVSRSLLSRAGIGAKFGVQETARAHMAATFEDCWLTRIGRGVESLDLDGDALHWDSDNADGLIVRRCIITDIGDDCIDGSDSFYVKTSLTDSIIYDLDDKLTTYWPGDAYANNLLLFACNKGFESVNGYPTQSTLADPRPFPQDYGGDWWVDRCIAWPGGTQSGYTCSRFSADYTMLTNTQHVGCGTGNLVADPLFVAPMTGGFPPDASDYRSSYDYNLQAGSPALTAGPGGSRIGWLGFPTAEPCSGDSDCGTGGAYDDENPCTVDTCTLGVCAHTRIDQCMACCADEDCDYGDPCVTGVCEAGGVCVFANNDGAACDDGLFCTATDVCETGVCVGTGDTCDDGSDCTTDACDETNDVCDHVALPAGTACGDATEGPCTHADTCDGAGVCLPNDEPDGADCDDGQFCTGAESCQAGICVSAGDPCAPLVCQEETDSCGQCADDDACSDGLFCNGVETCDAQGQCHAGVDPCPGQLCRELDDVCVDCLADSDCADDLFCNGVETCDVEGVCQPGAEPCASQLCREDDDSCVDCLDDGDCLDGLFCNGEEHCDASGLCLAGADPCDDAVACTDDACDEVADVCSHTAHDGNCPDDQLFCNGAEFCDAIAGCSHTGTPCGDMETCNEFRDACVPIGTCVMQPTGPIAGPEPNVWRWKDIAGVGNADHNYSANYQATYQYEDADVTVVYETLADSFRGTLTASNLKPNFAYQMKIVANPEGKYVSELTPTEYATLHAIGGIGRWWDATTGQINAPYNADHQMQSYLLFDHFETDNFGNADEIVYADSSFHVLFDSGAYHNAVTSLVDPAGPPANSVAYDEPYPVAVSVTVSAQNERGTPGQMTLPAGRYEGIVFLLTEESFHESGIGGYWASALACSVAFDVACASPADCDDGVGCTNDECIAGQCVFTPEDANCGDNGLFCDGAEVCDALADCTHTGDPCSDGVACTDDSCNEEEDVCVHVANHTLCDDGLFCTGEEVCDVLAGCLAGDDPCAGRACDEASDSCVDGACAGDEECDDGIFCNGAEQCVDQYCMPGIPPCGDACERCDESSDTCTWCLFDLDGDGFIGPGDFSFFAGCYGGSYACDPPTYRAGTMPCCAANFDGSADSFVGPGDFAGMAGCYGDDCGACDNCWGGQ